MINLIKFISFLSIYPMMFIFHSINQLSLIGEYNEYNNTKIYLLISFLLLGVFVVELLSHKRVYSPSSKPINIVFFSILLLIFIGSIANYVLVASSGVDSEMLYWSLTSLFVVILHYMIGLSFRMSSNTYNVIMILYIVMLSVVFLNIIDFTKIKYLNDAGMGHQGFGYIMFVTSFILLIFSKKFTIQVFVYLSTFFTLFVIGSRTELIFYAIIPLIAATLTLRSYSFAKVGGFIFFILLSVLFVLNFTDMANNNLDINTRSANILSLFDGQSNANREIFSNSTIQAIDNNPILGDYGSYAVKSHNIGDYAHNLLSIWGNHGILGFLLYIALIFLLLERVYSLFKTRSISTGQGLFLILVVSMILQLLFIRVYLFPLFGFVIGLSANPNIMCIKRN